MIHATCHTADNVRCIEFDATPWFSEANAPSIIDLAQRGWTSTAIADSLEHRRGYEGLHDLVEYAAKRLQSESLEDPNLGNLRVCRRWIRGHRLAREKSAQCCGKDPVSYGKHSKGHN
ncbi:hypothetical protein V1291_005523 [Nitrobacteraceae bacterium AZCC 1564]